MRHPLRRRKIGAPAFALLLLAAGVSASPRPSAGEGHWVSTWAAALHEPDLLLPGLSNTGFEDQTLRQIVRTSIGGRRIRIRFSAFGTNGVTIQSAHVGLAALGSGIVPGSDRVVRFGGSPTVVIPAGAPIVSDPVELSVPALSQLAITIFVPGTTGPATWHFEGRTTAYISPSGDYTGSEVMPVASTAQARFWLAGIDVLAPADAAAVVAFGDSVTDGTNSTVDADHRWPDELARRLAGDRRNNKLGVVNAGLAGNRLLHDFLGPNGLARFERDVLAQPGLSHIIVLLGNADIGEGWSGGIFPDQEVTVDQIIQGYGQLIDRAHARGVKVIGGTLNPFAGYFVPGTPFPFFSPANEEKRQTTNKWIRTAGEFDGVVDFDSLLRDPNDPSRMLPAYDSGDHVHPNDEGYKAMADAIDLTLFRSNDRH